MNKEESADKGKIPVTGWDRDGKPWKMPLSEYEEKYGLEIPPRKERARMNKEEPPFSGLQVVWYDDDEIRHEVPIEEYEEKFGTLGLIKEKNQMNTSPEGVRGTPPPLDSPENLPNQPVMGPPAPENISASTAGPKGLTEGRNVHYVSDWSGEHFAAIVTDVNPQQVGVVQLAAFDPYARGVNFYDGVIWDPTGQAKGSWHYIEPVE